MLPDVRIQVGLILIAVAQGLPLIQEEKLVQTGPHSLARRSQTLNGQMLGRKLLSRYKSHHKPPFWENSARDFRRQDLFAPSVLSFSIFQGKPSAQHLLLSKCILTCFHILTCFRGAFTQEYLNFSCETDRWPKSLRKRLRTGFQPYSSKNCTFFCWETPDLKEGTAGTFSHPAPFILHRREPGFGTVRRPV